MWFRVDGLWREGRCWNLRQSRMGCCEGTKWKEEKASQDHCEQKYSQPENVALFQPDHNQYILPEHIHDNSLASSEYRPGKTSPSISPLSFSQSGYTHRAICSCFFGDGKSADDPASLLFTSHEYRRVLLKRIGERLSCIWKSNDGFYVGLSKI